LQFPNLLLRSEAEIKDRSFNINEEMQEWSKTILTTGWKSSTEYFDEFSSLTQNLNERFHE
jgi:hypothetical protein